MCSQLLDRGLQAKVLKYKSECVDIWKLREYSFEIIHGLLTKKIKEYGANKQQITTTFHF